jgi:hypothetical protein
LKKSQPKEKQLNQETPAPENLLKVLIANTIIKGGVTKRIKRVDENQDHLALPARKIFTRSNHKKPKKI